MTFSYSPGSRGSDQMALMTRRAEGQYYRYCLRYAKCERDLINLKHALPSAVSIASAVGMLLACVAGAIAALIVAFGFAGLGSLLPPPLRVVIAAVLLAGVYLLAVQPVTLMSKLIGSGIAIRNAESVVRMRLAAALQRAQVIAMMGATSDWQGVLAQLSKDSHDAASNDRLSFEDAVCGEYFDDLKLLIHLAAGEDRERINRVCAEARRRVH